MLKEIKEILTEFNYINIYDGYQVVAEKWKNALAEDTEIIATSEFYTLGRSREPRMVTKGSGSKKREEQDGFTGSLIPNELIADKLYSENLDNIEDKKAKASEIESELSELVEAAKTEDTDENLALYDVLRKNAEDEPGNSFENRLVTNELKTVEKDSMEYEYLKKVDDLTKKRSKLNREIRNEEKELKEAVENRILELTDEEIDELVYEKWFGESIENLVNLVEAPLKEEIKILEMLNDRYKDTLSDIDDEIAELEKTIESLMSELVLTDE